MLELHPNYHYQTVIYQSHATEWVDDTLKFCEPYYKSVKEKPLKKIFPVYQTDELSNEPNLKYLTDFIIQSSYSILDSQGYDLSKHELYFEEMWAQEVLTYGHHFTHTHNNAQISGFYFLECPKDGVYPLFFDPRHGKVMTDLPEKNKDDITLATNDCNYKPSPGMFMFFNGWLPHGFQVSGSEEVCKFIHFNVGARRKYQK